MFFELNPGELTAHHVGLLNHIVAPSSWSETGNIPALVRLVKAYLRKDINSIIQNQKLISILGIFGILIKSSMQDHFAFEILRVILDVTPAYVPLSPSSLFPLPSFSFTFLFPFP